MHGTCDDERNTQQEEEVADTDDETKRWPGNDVSELPHDMRLIGTDMLRERDVRVAHPDIFRRGLCRQA